MVRVKFKGLAMYKGICRSVVMAAAAGLLLGGCAKIDDRAMSLVASSADAILLVNGRVLVGSLQIRIDRSGALSVMEPEPPASETPVDTLSSATPPAAAQVVRASCAGRLRFTSTSTGIIDLRCNDSTATQLNVAMLSETRGYGYAETLGGTASLTFGLAPPIAKAYLVVPPGKRLHELPQSPFFELR
jgi:hypothetical protein